MKSLRAFTLVELLVVIAIIAILASLSFAGIQGAFLSAKKVTARTEMANIVNAVQWYYTEYGIYPLTTGTMTNVYGTTAAPNRDIIDILRCTGTWAASTSGTLNSRQIQFIQPKVVDAKRGGVYRGDGNWYDPWGTQYLIFIDGSYAEGIDVSGQFTSITTRPSVQVGAASVGYYYGKSGSTVEVSTGNLDYSGANRSAILLSW